MKTKTILALALVLSATAAGAVQLPLKINFQGKLLDPSTNLPKNGSFNMSFSFYAAPTGGAAFYTEAQNGVSVSNGVFAVQIGSATGLTPDLFSGTSVYLGVTVSPDAEMTPRQQLVMSPYAFTAAQLVQNSDIRINPGTAYSTFTATGNLLVQFGVSAGTASFSGSLTASSGTFTTTGGSQFSLQTSSGISMQNGTLKLAAASGGIDAGGTGMLASTVTFTNTIFVSTGTQGCSTAGCGSATVVWLKNANAGTINAGCIVIAANPQSFNTVAGANSTLAVGVVYGANCATGVVCPIAYQGVVRVTTNAAVTAGNFVDTSAVACNAAGGVAAANGDGSIGRWLETTGAAGTAYALLGSH